MNLFSAVINLTTLEIKSISRLKPICSIVGDDLWINEYVCLTTVWASVEGIGTSAVQLHILSTEKWNQAVLVGFEPRTF